MSSNNTSYSEEMLPPSNSTDDPLDFIKTLMDKACTAPLRCEQRPIHILLMGYGFLFVFLLAMFGNCINLLIYNSDHIRFYIAIRMLCTRLLMNTCTMLFILPQALRIVGVWQPNSSMDHLYWKYYPYQAYFINVFGFCAMWLTVLMTGECYLHVFFPNRSKSLCTKKNLSRSYVVVLCFALLLAIIYPLNRTATITMDKCRQFVVRIVASEAPFALVMEQIITMANLFCAIIVPMSLLVFMTLSIVWRLMLRKSSLSNSSHFTSEKRCVITITLITTSLQLLAELPPVPVLIYATLNGPKVINEAPVCIWHTIGVFFGQCNMSLSFYVYLSFSQKFRQMVFNRLSELFSVGTNCFVKSAPTTRKFDDRGQRKRLMVPKGSELEVTDAFLMSERSISCAEDIFL